MERILLVEDNEAIVLGLKYLLAQEGFETRVAVTVREAKEALREKEGFDLALLDVMLPDGDGFELCKSIRERFDYTKWQRTHFDAKSPECIREEALAFAKNHPFTGNAARI